ncbi:MAG: carbonate dehydratase [Planctomycetales bacterium]|nr:carbonate dehydratase [Planctomycetales bacterium]
MRELATLFQKNADWAQEMQQSDPDFFDRLSKQQAPRYLWIGCADSRVPANQIVGLAPGDVFVHRNVANVVVHTDLNCLSVVQYAVDVLKVEHIIVCGHYGCGGVAASMEDASHGLIDNWLRHIQDVHYKHRERLDAIPEKQHRVNRLCELNVIDQVANVCRTTILQDAWRREQNISVHGWIYGLGDGLLRDLDMCISAPDQLAEAYRLTVESSDANGKVRPKGLA